MKYESRVRRLPIRPINPEDTFREIEKENPELAKILRTQFHEAREIERRKNDPDIDTEWWNDA